MANENGNGELSGKKKEKMKSKDGEKDKAKENAKSKNRDKPSKDEKTKMAVKKKAPKPTPAATNGGADAPVEDKPTPMEVDEENAGAAAEPQGAEKTVMLWIRHAEELKEEIEELANARKEYMAMSDKVFKKAASTLKHLPGLKKKIEKLSAGRGKKGGKGAAGSDGKANANSMRYKKRVRVSDAFKAAFGIEDDVLEISGVRSAVEKYAKSNDLKQGTKIIIDATLAKLTGLEPKSFIYGVSIPSSVKPHLTPVPDSDGAVGAETTAAPAADNGH